MGASRAGAVSAGMELLLLVLVLVLSATQMLLLLLLLSLLLPLLLLLLLVVLVLLMRLLVVIRHVLLRMIRPEHVLRARDRLHPTRCRPVPCPLLLIACYGPRPGLGAADIAQLERRVEELRAANVRSAVPLWTLDLHCCCRRLLLCGLLWVSFAHFGVYG